MKNLIAFFLTSCLLFLLAGCTTDTSFWRGDSGCDCAPPPACDCEEQTLVLPEYRVVFIPIPLTLENYEEYLIVTASSITGKPNLFFIDAVVTLRTPPVSSQTHSLNLLGSTGEQNIDMTRIIVITGIVLIPEIVVDN